MEIISRKEWGARQPRKLSEVIIDTWAAKGEFIVHYSYGNPNQSMKSLQDYFMNSRGYNDIGYSFVVHPVTGQIWEGRGWLVRGGHTLNHNRPGIGVCVLGYGDTSPEALRAVRWLWEEAQRLKGGPLSRHGHRDMGNTSCPGDKLYRWVHAGMPVDSTTTPGTPANWTENLVNNLPELKLGATGKAVKTIQGIVERDRTAGTPIDIDGQWGPLTDAAVKAWQASHNVPGSVKSDGTGDGVFGRNSWTFALSF